MHVEASPGPFEQVDVQALAIAVFKDEKPGEGFLKKLDELTNGFIKSAIESEEFTGKEGDTAYFHLIGNDKVKASRLLLVGAGDPADYKISSVSNLVGTAVRALRAKNAKSIAVVPRIDDNAEAAWQAEIDRRVRELDSGTVKPMPCLRHAARSRAGNGPATDHGSPGSSC